MFYNFWGSLNTLLIFVSLYGIFLQLRKIQLRKLPLRKSPGHASKTITAVLSIKQFLVSFLAYISFYIYGYSIAPFNHFMVWPRLIAASLILFILYEIWHDRKSLHSRHSILFALFVYLLAWLGFILSLNVESLSINDQGKVISTTLIVLITLFLAFGYYGQIKLILQNGCTGAVELKMSQTILMMDISTIGFACSMGLSNGWPLILLASVSAITKLIIMYLFLWVKTSKTAQQRRLLSNH